MEITFQELVRRKRRKTRSRIGNDQDKRGVYRRIGRQRNRTSDRSKRREAAGRGGIKNKVRIITKEKFEEN